ncbi:MAG: hypothetical protein KDA73_11320 [Rhodobacteraceae bacterium]|nr:hypothetical protein [Paracoccaceae bacterium]
MLIPFLTGLSLTGPAGATVVGGAITGGSAARNGEFVKLDPEDAFRVGQDTFQTENLYAFDEDQNITIPAPIEVDIGTGPQTGEVVASHYVFFDPGSGRSQTGYVEFDAPIYGVAAQRGTMADSDYLANTQVTYLSPGARGLEGGDKVEIDPENPNRLLVNWAASSPGDYVRVFTRRSPLADAASGGKVPLSTLRRP